MSRTDKPSFVIQKHAARRLHYDCRLEVDGAMPSWAAPKGPSTGPKGKRRCATAVGHTARTDDL